MLLELTAAILEPQGYRVLCFSDAVSALYHFSEANPKPDLVITDYAMPGMNGQELISGCRTANPEQRILLVSGTVDESIFCKSTGAARSIPGQNPTVRIN